MKPFLEKVGVSIASRIGLTAAIALIAAALLGAGLWWVKRQNPRDTVKAETGAKVDIEELAFYGNGTQKVSGKVYRPNASPDEKHPAVIYCQNTQYGDSWCRSLAGMGVVAYCFDFQGDGEKAREKELETVLGGIQNLRHVDKKRIYLLGEGNGCLTACNLAFGNSRKLAGLMLLSPGFNPLEISRKAKRYERTILVMDDALGQDVNLKEIRDFIY